MLPKAASGRTRSFGHVGSMSGLPKSGHDWAMNTRPSLTPLADLGRSAGQAPLHRLHAAGIAAGGDDAKLGARLFERARIDVGLGGGLLDVARMLGATCKRVLEEAGHGQRLPQTRCPLCLLRNGGNRTA